MYDGWIAQGWIFLPKIIICFRKLHNEKTDSASQCDWTYCHCWNLKVLSRDSHISCIGTQPRITKVRMAMVCPCPFSLSLSLKVAACLQLAMNLLQKKIAHLNEETHISRKCIKELECELDVCKQDVRTQQTNDTMWRIIGEATSSQGGHFKFKGKACSVEDTKEEQKHYIQAIEEKKGLQIY